jgi:hypothetical protein
MLERWQDLERPIVPLMILHISRRVGIDSHCQHSSRSGELVHGRGVDAVVREEGQPRACTGFQRFC